MHEIERHILKKFMYNEALSYNQIWDKICESNKFNYYLKKAVDDNLLEKIDNSYQLTNSGRHHISTLDGIQIKKKPAPLVAVFILGYDEKTGKVLMNMRKKQPFMNYLGIPGGKLDFGSITIEQAKKEFAEETGLSGTLRLGSIVTYITRDSKTDETTHHMVGFNFLATGLTGDLIESDREGENLFMLPEEITTYKHYPDIPHCVDDLLALQKGKRDGIIYREAIRTFEDNSFTGVQFLDY